MITIMITWLIYQSYNIDVMKLANYSYFFEEWENCD